MNPRMHSFDQQRWRSLWWRLAAPAAAATVVMTLTPQATPAQSGWKWFGSQPPAAVESPRPQNGFAASVQRLMEQARREANAGQFDAALRTAERAHKIADAASAVLGDDPNCSPDVTGQFLADLTRLKEATGGDVAIAADAARTPPTVAITPQRPVAPTVVAPVTPAADDAVATVAPAVTLPVAPPVAPTRSAPPELASADRFPAVVTRPRRIAVPQPVPQPPLPETPLLPARPSLAPLSQPHAIAKAVPQPPPAFAAVPKPVLATPPAVTAASAARPAEGWVVRDAVTVTDELLVTGLRPEPAAPADPPSVPVASGDSWFGLSGITIVGGSISEPPTEPLEEVASGWTPRQATITESPSTLESTPLSMTASPPMSPDTVSLNEPLWNDLFVFADDMADDATDVLVDPQPVVLNDPPGDSMPSDAVTPRPSEPAAVTLTERPAPTIELLRSEAMPEAGDRPVGTALLVDSSLVQTTSSPKPATEAPPTSPAASVKPSEIVSEQVYGGPMEWSSAGKAAAVEARRLSPEWGDSAWSPVKGSSGAAADATSIENSQPSAPPSVPRNPDSGRGDSAAIDDAPSTAVVTADASTEHLAPLLVTTTFVAPASGAVAPPPPVENQPQPAAEADVADAAELDHTPVVWMRELSPAGDGPSGETPQAQGGSGLGLEAVAARFNVPVLTIRSLLAGGCLLLVGLGLWLTRAASRRKEA